MKLKTLLLGLTFVLFYSVGFSQTTTKKQKQSPKDKHVEQKVKVVKGTLVKKESPKDQQVTIVMPPVRADRDDSQKPKKAIKFDKEKANIPPKQATAIKKK